MYLMLYKMIHKFIVCQPHHVSFWFETVCFPRIKKWVAHNEISEASAGRFLDVMITGLHDRTCKQCHNENNNEIILNENVWEPDAWMQLLLMDKILKPIKFIGDFVKVKHMSATRDRWDFVKQPCEEYRVIIWKIFDIK